MKFPFPALKSDLKLLSWRSVIVIGFTYLIAVIVILVISGSLYLVAESFEPTNPFEQMTKFVLQTLSYSIFIASWIGIFIKLVADAVSSSYFLKKVTDRMFDKSEN